MFLFELYLVFSKEVKDSNGKAKYQYKMKMMTTDMSITEHVEGDECKFAVWAGRSPSSESKVSYKLPPLIAIIYYKSFVGHPKGKQSGYEASLGEENPPTDARYVLWDLQGQRLPAISVGASAKQQQKLKIHDQSTVQQRL